MEVPRRSTKVQGNGKPRQRMEVPRSTMEAGYINGKSEEVPPDTQRSHRGSQSHRYAPQWSTMATAKVRPPEKSIKVYDDRGKALLYRKVYQVRKEFGPAGGVRDPESQEAIAPNPNPNDSSWSQGLDLRRRQLLIKKCSDPKIWIQEVYRRVPQPRPRQWSAEAITVSGIININVETTEARTKHID